MFTGHSDTGDMATDRTNEKANPERLAFSILVGPRESNPTPTDYESAALTKDELEA